MKSLTRVQSCASQASVGATMATHPSALPLSPLVERTNSGIRISIVRRSFIDSMHAFPGRDARARMRKGCRRLSYSWPRIDLGPRSTKKVRYTSLPCLLDRLLDRRIRDVSRSFPPSLSCLFSLFCDFRFWFFFSFSTKERKGRDTQEKILFFFNRTWLFKSRKESRNSLDNWIILMNFHSRNWLFELLAVFRKFWNATKVVKVSVKLKICKYLINCSEKESHKSIDDLIWWNTVYNYRGIVLRSNW